MRRKQRSVRLAAAAAALFTVMSALAGCGRNYNGYQRSFRATVSEADGDRLTVVPDVNEKDDGFTVSVVCEGFDGAPGDVIDIQYNRYREKKNGASVKCISWAYDRSGTEYSGEWLDRDTASYGSLSDVRVLVIEITEIYSDCFFGVPYAEYYENGRRTGGIFNIVEGNDYSRYLNNAGLDTDTVFKFNLSVAGSYRVGDIFSLSSGEPFLYDAVNNRAEVYGVEAKIVK